MGNSPRSSANAKMAMRASAWVLNERRCNSSHSSVAKNLGLEAQAEQTLRDHAGRTHRIDVIVELTEHAVAIEAEFGPGTTVEADAQKRLPTRPLVWRGLQIASAFTVLYPSELSRMAEGGARASLVKREDLIFTQLIPQAEDAQRALFEHLEQTPTPVGTVQGSVRTLAESLHSFWIQSDGAYETDQTVDEAARAIERAKSQLDPHAALPDTDRYATATTALVWLNALLFHELLSANLDPASLPAPHTGTRIQPPRPDPVTLQRQWEDILAINWFPIFQCARDSLQNTPAKLAAAALNELQPTARQIAARRVIRRHDVAGRIFHRLMSARKFLATNYTTIPAAVLLAGLAFDPNAPSWGQNRWREKKDFERLRIVDPACGTGTLLMAAVQEILKAHRRATGRQADPAIIRILLEKSVWGFDVVPSAIHLTGATLAMAESRQLIEDMPLYPMSHDVHGGLARLGSLDFLARSPCKGQPDMLKLTQGTDARPGRTTGTGKTRLDTNMPMCDLIIANPPYTRAGGPGDKDNTSWNPLFGSTLSRVDAQIMNKALKRTLNGTPASLYAGLGSAFVQLADERLMANGRLALVLPATALTGSRWAPIRRLLVDNYEIEWILVSHDNRNRHARGELPGRRWVSFSESTRIAETLIIANKKPSHVAHVDDDAVTRFVNLRNNPDTAGDATALMNALLAKKHGRPNSSEEIETPSRVWAQRSPHLFCKRSLLTV